MPAVEMSELLLKVTLGYQQWCKSGEYVQLYLFITFYLGLFSGLLQASLSLLPLPIYNLLLKELKRVVNVWTHLPSDVAKFNTLSAYKASRFSWIFEMFWNYLKCPVCNFQLQFYVSHFCFFFRVAVSAAIQSCYPVFYHK